MNPLFEHETEKLEVLKEIRNNLQTLIEKHGQPQRKYFTKKEIAAHYNMSLTCVDEKIRKGEWKAYKLTDKSIRLNIDEIERSLRGIQLVGPRSKGRKRKTGTEIADFVKAQITKG